jgi:hypothetical protein
MARVLRAELMHWHFPRDKQRAIAIVYLVIVPLLIVLLLILMFVNWRHEQGRALRQSKANKTQITILHNALAEACHATSVQYGITSALLLYFAGKPDAHELVDVLGGYGTDLSSLSACQGIARP